MVLAYLDTNSGIAGDMLLAALVDAGADANYLRDQIKSLGLKDVELIFSETQRQCFRAIRLDVSHPEEHAHRHLAEIETLLANSQLTPREREISRRLFRKLAEAEARVHGTTVEQVHFHEVGAVDSLVDICGIAVALCNLGVSRLIASATPTGTGSIQIAHGRVSLPAPATAELLRGVPVRGSRIEAELTTPTGAAVLATLVDGFGPLPDMQISRIGYGAGHRELVEQANLLRVLIGAPLIDDADEVVVLEANLDDISGEQIGYAIERLWQCGALDVFTTAIGMKKNRPATKLSVISRPELRYRLEACLFEHTGTLGIRRSVMQRSKVHREIIRVPTPVGEARVKIAWPSQQDTPRFAPEYDDCVRLADQHGQTLESVFRIVVEAAEKWYAAQRPSRCSTDADRPHAPPLESTTPSAAPSDESRHAHDHIHDHDHDHHHHHGH